MKSLIITVLFALASIVAAPAAPAAAAKAGSAGEMPEGAAADGAEGEDRGQRPGWGFLPVAIPYYMPETSFGIGFSFLLYHRGEEAEAGKPDEISVYGTYTVKNQASVGVSTDLYFRGIDYRLTGSVDFSRFPDLFWGIGPGTPECGDESFTSMAAGARGAFLFRTVDLLYIGPYYRFGYDVMRRREAGGRLIQGHVPGSDGTLMSGFGVNLIFDSRDSVFYPRHGFYCDLKGLVFRRELGNEYNFSTLEMDLRYYRQIRGDLVLALQLYAALGAGTVPLQAMPRLGGDVMLRGYYQGRYRDRNYGALQGELRFPLFWRLGGVVFGGVGQVAAVPGELFQHELKIAFGGGLRITADRDEHINIRLDAGFDRDLNPNYYLMIKEAF
ncbi:MAG: BamA/TamA family outer membrane protein [Spirochaetes bacterium]|nr:BamA/TamA family outer membrane protein [Spirochaetota bacterium]